MSSEEIFDKVKEIIVEQLGVAEYKRSCCLGN